MGCAHTDTIEPPFKGLADYGEFSYVFKKVVCSACGKKVWAGSIVIQNRQKWIPMWFYVYGAKWANTKFDSYLGGSLELRGPFERESEALDVWREWAWQTVDDCHYRVFVVKSHYSYAEMFSQLK